jgi:hypothetical protein
LSAWTVAGVRLSAAPDGPARGGREVTVGIEGKLQRILNEPDYQTLPQKENDALLLRIDSVERTVEGQFEYTFAFMGLQSGVFNLADYLQTASGKRLRDRIPAMSVTVRALLPENAETDFSQMPQALPPRRIPYRPSLAAICLLWVGAGWLLFYKPRPKPVPPPPAPVPAPPKSLGEILEPLAMKAARKTITTEEKVLLEQTILQYWSEKLGVSDRDKAEQYEIIRDDPEGGILLAALERWLYQPASLILTSEVAKALQPYFEIPAPGSGPLPKKKKRKSRLGDDEEPDDDDDEMEDEDGEDEDTVSDDDQDDEPEDEEEDEDGVDPRPSAASKNKKREPASVEEPDPKRRRRGKTVEEEDSSPPEEPPPVVGRRPGYRRRK